jgi:hypothetical protein
MANFNIQVVPLDKPSLYASQETQKYAREHNYLLAQVWFQRQRGEAPILNDALQEWLKVRCVECYIVEGYTDETGGSLLVAYKAINEIPK